ncbi:hemerythrin domain-containing protein [Streptomyces sp. TRM66268-LWL]|uniref:Hemerythrin domain-containing protein n=1 Tax=Streptomyces polyasparticus TaxID=2767826 RepID=A0ABR7SXE0_9ACTN|nr:hemerythrin domain-containing protein [Streptomyces polyasparticus]MBC9719454.1 hemerythrin domain-containing protein [Streptomyces polyasparticus]
MIRRDLDTVRQLVHDITSGLSPTEIRTQIRSLQTDGPLWQLKVNCLQYCRFVHSHHHRESAAIFPALRRSNPALNPVVDRLEADHQRVSGLLDEAEAAAQSLGEPDSNAPRQRLTQALQALADDLLDHLAYEEEQISDTLRTWTRWPNDRTGPGPAA